MMKKIPRIVSIVTVVALLAAIPASTQILAGSGTREVDLGMLTMVNRLELSEEQMDALQEILSGVLDERATLDDHRVAFEEAMIAFNGSNDELDAALSAFSEKQMAQAEDLREALASAMESIGDILSFNQGLRLRGLLPQLQGMREGGQFEETDGTFRMHGSRPPVDAETRERGGLRQGLMGMQRGTQQNAQSKPQQNGAFGPGSRSEILSKGRGRENVGAVREQMAQRFQSIEGDIPEARREQLSRRFGIHDREGAVRMEQGIIGEPEETTRGSMLRGCLGGISSSQENRAMVFIGEQRMRNHRDPFGSIEQWVEILEMKLDALNEGA